MRRPDAIARAPRGHGSACAAADVPAARLVDAAYFPGGRADVLCIPDDEAGVAAAIGGHRTVLAIGAQSSLTGGATPDGGALVSTERFDRLDVDPVRRRAVCGAGVSASRLADAARPFGLACGSAPTYGGATVGGMTSTNAGGAATFRHGTLRTAVRRITVVLADGSVLDVARGEARAASDGTFVIELAGGDRVSVPVPTYRGPDVPKCSAGYFAAADMDLVDLFVGSEGTLGIVTEVELDLVSAGEQLACWLPLDSETRALAHVRALREAAFAARASAGRDGIEVPAIEWFDGRCASLLREDGVDRAHGIRLPPEVDAVLLFTVDLSGDAGDAIDRLARLLGGDAPRLDVALPGERAKAERFAAMREAVPLAVNHRVRDARLRDPRVTKAAGDFIVPWARFPESLRRYAAELASRGLDHAVWGHVSDGNVHPNAIPRDGREVAAAHEALLACARWVVSAGGSPLAEHGVGRNPAKQEMLRVLRGDRGIEEMRAVRRALDPQGRLAPGVLFPR